MGERAAAFSLFGLDINLDETALWADSAAVYRAAAPMQPAANDDAPAPAAPEPQVPRRRAPPLSPKLPVRLMQLMDWTAAAAVAHFAALWGVGSDLAHLPVGDAAAFLVSAAALKAGLWLTGAYRTTPAQMRAEQGAGGLALGAVLGLLLAASLAPDARSVAALAVTLPAAALALAALHAVLAAVTSAAFHAGAFTDHVVIVGATDAARCYADEAQRSGQARVLAVFDDRRARTSAVAGLPVAGDLNQLLLWEGLAHVDRVIIAVAGSPVRRRAIADRLSVIPNRIDVLVEDEGGCLTRCISGAPRDHARATLKRGLDITLGLALLAVFAAPMLLIAALVRLESRGPALVRARAWGRNNRIFALAKFRTTRAAGAKRTPTRLGPFLKRTRLDDLPQLFNVLAGDMSVIGPRPHLLSRREPSRPSADYAHRRRVKPGLVGWAHVNGAHGPARTPSVARQRLRLDLDYATRASIMLDLHILMRAACDALCARR